MYLIFQCETIEQSNQMGWLLVIIFAILFVISLVVGAYILYSKNNQIEYLKSLIPVQELQKLEKAPLSRGFALHVGLNFQIKQELSVLNVVHLLNNFF